MLYRYENFFRKDFAVLRSKMNSKNEILMDKVDTSSIDLKEKSIVVLCGNNSRSMRKAEFYAYLLRNWLKNSEQNIKTTTYSVYYPNEQPLFNEDSQFDLNYKDLAKDIFQQTIYKDGKVKSIEEIKKDLRNVTFFGHSAGGYVMNKLVCCFGEMLKDAGFNKSDIRKIYDSVVFVAYAPYVLVQDPIKAVYVTPIYDSIGSVRHAYKKIIKSKDSISVSSRINIFGENKIDTKVYASFINKYKEIMDRKHTLYYASKKALIATPNLLYLDGNNEDHNFAGVINYSRNNPYQTKAGKLTAKFLSQTLDYCLSTKREEFDINDLYKQAIKIKLSDADMLSVPDFKEEL